MSETTSSTITQVISNPTINATSQFGNGLVDQSANAEYFPNGQPAGAATTPWSVVEWSKGDYITPQSMTVGAPSTDNAYTTANYSWGTANNESTLQQYTSATGSSVYNLTASNGSLNGGGADLFLAASTVYPGSVTFDNNISYSLDARITSAQLSYYNATAQASGAVLAQVFTGFSIVFNASNSVNYNPLLPTYDTFIQIGITNSSTPGGSSGLWFTDNLSQGGTNINYGDTLPGDQTLPFAVSQSTTPTLLTYDLNSYLSAMMQQATNLPSYALNPAMWSLQGVFIGMETENTDDRSGAITNQAQGSVSAGLEISNLSVTEQAPSTTITPIAKALVSGVTTPATVSIQGTGAYQTLGNASGNFTLSSGTAGVWDTYTFGTGYGQDTIINGHAGNTGPSGNLQMTSGVSLSQLWFTQSGNNLVIRIIGSTSQMTVQGWFNSATPYSQIANLILPTGPYDYITTAAITKLATAMTTWANAHPGFNPQTATQLPSDATFIASLQPLWAHGESGTTGNDVLGDAFGNNMEAGYGGNDTYQFGVGYGHDTILNGLASNSGPTGTLQIGAGINASNLWLTNVGGNLIVQVLGSTSSVVIVGWFVHSYNQLQCLKLADGTQINTSAISVMAQAMTTYANNNPGFNPSTNAYPPSDSTLQNAINAGWAHTITGTSAFQTFGNQVGSNVLIGSNGVWDTYQFGIGYGQTTIVNGQVNNSGPSGNLQLMSGVSLGLLWFTQSGNNLVIQILGSQSQMTVQGWFNAATPYRQLGNLVLPTGPFDYITTAAITKLATTMTAWANAHPSFNPLTATQLPSDATLNAALQPLWAHGETAAIGNNVLGDPFGNNMEAGYGITTTYEFGLGYGQNTIINGVSTNQNATGTLQIGAGINASNLWMTDVNGNLMIQVLGTTSSVNVAGWFQNYYSHLTCLQLSDGTQLSTNAISALARAMTAYQGSHPFNAQTATQMPTNSALQTAIDAAWSYTITGTSAYQTLGTAIGNVTLSSGTAGVWDTYQFGAGYGQDTIVNGQTSGTGPSGNLQLMAGLTLGQLWITQSGNDLLIQILGSQSQITVQGWFNSTTPYSTLGNLILPTGPFDYISTTAITKLATTTTAWASSNPGFNPVTATQLPSDPTLIAALQPLWAHGDSGTTANNVLGDAFGNNIEAGNGGNDTYEFGLGYGQDTVINGLSTNTSPTGTLQIGAGVSANNLWLSNVNGNLMIQIMGTTSSVSISGWFNNSYSHLANLQLADGTQLSTSAISTLARAMTTYQGSHSFNAQTATQMPSNTTLQAAINTAWAHAVTGTSGNDTLGCSYGNDTFVGNGGNDTYQLNSGMGQDNIINGIASANTAHGTLDIGIGINANNIWLDRVDSNGNLSATGSGMRFLVMGTTSSETVENWFTPNSAHSVLSEIQLVGSGLKLDTGIGNLLTAMEQYETTYAAQHSGAVFNPMLAANSAITSQSVLTAIGSDWHH